MNHALSAAAFALIGAPPASAEVVSAAPASFEVASTVTVAAPPDAVWRTLTQPRLWWDKEHTYSGDSANLYLDRQATGCFCEKLADKGSIEHARIVSIQPLRMLRLDGALGPLQAEAVTGTLTFTLEPEGAEIKVTMTYVVGGYMRAGGEALAPAVDRVMAHQLDLMKAAAEAAGQGPASASP